MIVIIAEIGREADNIQVWSLVLHRANPGDTAGDVLDTVWFHPLHSFKGYWEHFKSESFISCLLCLYVWGKGN